MKRKLVIIIIALLVLVTALGLWAHHYYNTSNPRNAATVGDIPTPRGFTRVEDSVGSYTAYLRSLPLQPKGSKLHLHSGQVAKRQILAAAVVDQPLLCKTEQCADVVIRLRDEYLWRNGRYDEISHVDVNHITLSYLGDSLRTDSIQSGLISGDSLRADFERYLKLVYEWCNTRSLSDESQERPFLEVRPGDFLVHPARPDDNFGHAIVVADVAYGPNGKVAVLFLEGNTPARQKHIVRNINPFRNPWFIIGDNTQTIRFIKSRFYPGELHKWED